jgi:hypothetical protein
MFPKIINLTLLILNKSIEVVLEDYQKKFYQPAFSRQELRQKIVSNVLTKIPNQYTIIEDEQELPKDPNFLYCYLEQRVRLEILIRESLVYLLQENLDETNFHISPKENPLNDSSHWVG